MQSSPRLGRGDALALVSLVLTATVIAWPIFRGGYLTYIDNPVHLAEIYELARTDGNGWSELGFAGLPVATLHSPIFYPMLAYFSRIGVPLEPVYTAFLFAGVISPSIAFYLVARRRISAIAAFILSYLLLVQPSMVWGIGSPFAGMWTHGIATALLIPLFDLLARPKLTSRQHLAASLLLATAVLTHLFVLPLVAFMAAITTVMHRRTGAMTLRELKLRIAGFFVAALASAKYWLTMMWVAEVSAAPHPAFRLADIVTRLVLPCEPLYLLDARIPEGIRYDLFLTDVLPSLIPVALGILGFARWRKSEDRLGEAGFYLSMAILGSLLVHRYVPLGFLGPVSWRLIDWARLGLMFAAMGPLSSPWVERLGQRGFVAAALLAPALGVWWGLPLRRDNPESLHDEVRQVESLWTWLAANARKDWGRIYLEDAFGWQWNKGGLAQSHLLVLTRHHVGLPQLGAYYGVVPYKLRWTLSEFNSLFSTRDPGKEWVLEAMGKTNVGAVVTSNSDMAQLIEGTGAFDMLYRTFDYTVFRLRNAEDRIVSELAPSNHVSDVEARVGDVRLKLRSEFSRSRILVKVAWHPFWRMEGATGAWLRESPEGFLVVDDLPEGESTLHLWYEPSIVPGAITRVGWSLESIWALALALSVKGRRRVVRADA